MKLILRNCSSEYTRNDETIYSTIYSRITIQN